MKIKQEFAKFVLFLYNTHIKENWNEYNTFGEIIFYPIWIIRTIAIILIFPVFIPEFLFKKTKLYKNLMAGYNAGLSTPLNSKELNQRINLNRSNFLNIKNSSGKIHFRNYQ